MKDAGALAEKAGVFRKRKAQGVVCFMSNDSTGGVVPESVESWTCQIDGKLKHFYRTMEASVFKVWSQKSIGHRAPGCTPIRGGGFAGFMFTGDGERALVSVSAEVFQRGKLTIVIDRYATQPEDIDPDYATWADIGQVVATWLRGWIREHYNVEPVAQRAGRPSWDDYNVTGDQERTEPRGAKVGNPGRKSHAEAIERLRAGEDEAEVRADWRADYGDETGLYPNDTQSGETELWRKSVKGKV